MKKIYYTAIDDGNKIHIHLKNARILPDNSINFYIIKDLIIKTKKTPKKELDEFKDLS